MKKLLVILLILPFWFSSIQAAEETAIYLVRHAEKLQDGTKDPGLSKQGIQRANKLAELLKDKNIGVIYTTDYKRTRQTAQPLADQLGLKLVVYNPKNLINFANDLKLSKKNTLVVGHSNTTNKLSQLLTNLGTCEIKEDEYNRLYVITLGKEHSDLQLLRYD